MNITIITGSNRNHSSSTKLCRYIEKVLLSKGHHVHFIDLYTNSVPLYCPDDEEDDPNVVWMKESVRGADAVVLSTPEYHGGISGVLKNALDYLGGEHFDSKMVLSVSSSGGAVGVSSLLQLQAIVRNVHGINCPEWISMGGDNREFSLDGEPENVKMKERVHRVLEYFESLSSKLADPQ